MLISDLDDLKSHPIFSKSPNRYNWYRKSDDVCGDKVYKPFIIS